MTDRAISDVVAFVLTFSIIITSVGAVYVLGFGSLADLRNSEQINSADRTMQGISEAMADVHRESAPSRAIDIGLDGGSLTTRDSKLTVVTSTASGTQTHVVDVGALTTAAKDTPAELVYESGMAYRVRKDGQTVQKSPALSCTNEAAIVDVVELDGQTSVSVPDSLELFVERRTTELRYPDVAAGERAADASAVEIEIDDTYRPAAWTQYFETDTTGWTETSDGYECTGVDAVYLRVTVLHVDVIY